MAALSLQAALGFCCPSRSSCYANIKLPKAAVAENFPDGYSVATVKKVLRRSLLQFMGFGLILSHACHYPVIAKPMLEMKEPEVARAPRISTGVRIEDIIEGEGPEAHEGDLVEINYVCRRSNGYFVHSTVNQFSGESMPVLLPLDDKQIIKGLKDVLVGMRVGGKRRALIPPAAGYVNENLKPVPDEFGPRRSLLSHARESLVFEVQLLKVL